MSYFATLLRQTGIAAGAAPTARPAAAGVFDDAPPSAPAPLEAVDTADSAPLVDAAAPRDLALDSVSQPTRHVVSPSSHIDRPMPVETEIVRPMDGINRPSSSPFAPIAADRERRSGPVTPPPSIIETTVERAIGARGEQGSAADSHRPIPISEPLRAEMEGRRETADAALSGDAEPVREEHEVRSTSPSPIIPPITSRRIVAESGEPAVAETSAAMPIGGEVEEVPAGPRNFAEALAAARRWVSATPLPGERPAPTESVHLAEEYASFEAMPVPGERIGRSRQPAAEVAHEEVRLSIGTLQVIVEDPAAQPPRPAPQPARSAPVSDARARLRRHYIRVD